MKKLYFCIAVGVDKVNDAVNISRGFGVFESDLESIGFITEAFQKENPDKSLHKTATSSIDINQVREILKSIEGS